MVPCLGNFDLTSGSNDKTAVILYLIGGLCWIILMKPVGHGLEDKRHAPAGNQLITSIICASATPISTITGAWRDAASAGDCLGLGQFRTRGKVT